MGTAKEGKRGIVQGLKPKRHTIDACCGQVCKSGGFNRRWVGLECNLDVIRKAPKLFCCLYQGGHCGWRHERRGSPSKKDRSDRPPLQLVRLVRYVRQQCTAP